MDKQYKKKSKSKQSGGVTIIDTKNKMIKSKDEDHKCAPSKKYSEDSCFTLESLIDMSNAFNNYVDMGKINKTKIIFNVNGTDNLKKELVKQLNNRLKDICEDQLCWVRQDFVKLTKNKKDITKNTFRPIGPQGRFSWLSTSDIDNVVNQYESIYPDFKYLGTVPMDFDDLPVLGISNLNLDKLYNSGKYRLGMVLNTDEHYKNGSHWIGLYADIKNFKIYFFDSYGKQPEKRVRNFVRRIAKWCVDKHLKNDADCSDSFMKPNIQNNIEKIPNVDIRYNHNRQQYKGSECGVYSINFILRLLKNETFDDIINNKLPDDKVNKCREIYFTFDDKNKNNDDDN